MLYLGIILVALRPLLASAIAWDAPAHTISELFPEQFSAVETAAPELLKRDVPPSSVCGYFPAYSKIDQDTLNELNQANSFCRFVCNLRLY
jgi:hypothetical protein